MNETKTHYDVAIIGASIAGSTAAILFARQGLRVALIERNSNIDAYKKVCTHYIQATAMPTIKHLGLDQAIEAAGGVRNNIDVWTRWGWVSYGDDRFYGYNIRREVLDPMIRRQAASTPNVDFLPGTTLRELIFNNEGRVIGIRGERQRQMIDIQARLVVGADGRYSRTADLAGLPAEVKPNNRFIYFAYYRNLSLNNGRRSQMWLLDPGVAYAMPNDANTTVVAVMLPKTELAAFKKDIEGNFVRFFDNVPDGPNLREAERVSKVIGMLDIPNISRPEIGPGVALIGDAALASDPVWGIGCGWAFQSAEWLVKATAKALLNESDEAVDEALKGYQHKHQTILADRAARNADFATARPLNVVERLMYAAAAREPRMARYTGPHAVHLTTLRQLPSLKIMAQALRINLNYQASHLSATLSGWFKRPVLKPVVYKHQGA